MRRNERLKKIQQTCADSRDVCASCAATSPFASDENESGKSAKALTASMLLHAAVLFCLLRAGLFSFQRPPEFIPVDLIDISAVTKYTIGEQTRLKRGAPQKKQTAGRTVPSPKTLPLPVKQQIVPAQTKTTELLSAPAAAVPAISPSADVETMTFGPARTGANNGAAVGSGDGGDADTTTLSYLDALRLRIDRAKRYPLSARRAGIEGVAQVRFTISPKGRLSGVRLVKTSGSAVLDNEAVQTVYRAAPYPAPLTGANFPATIDIAFTER